MRGRFGPAKSLRKTETIPQRRLSVYMEIRPAFIAMESREGFANRTMSRRQVSALVRTILLIIIQKRIGGGGSLPYRLSAFPITWKSVAIYYLANEPPIPTNCRCIRLPWGDVDSARWKSGNTSRNIRYLRIASS